MEGSGGRDEGSGIPVWMMEGSGGCLEVPEPGRACCCCLHSCLFTFAMMDGAHLAVWNASQQTLWRFVCVCVCLPACSD